jgi:hypothetical protein
MFRIEAVMVVLGSLLLGAGLLTPPLLGAGLSTPPDTAARSGDLAATGGDLVTIAAAQAGKSALKEQVEQFLETGWTRSVKTREAAEAQYLQLQRQAAGDWRIPYAYALVQLRQLRYPDALRLLDEVLTIDKKNLAAQKLRVWVRVLMKDYGKALAAIEQLAELLPADEAAGDAETPYLEIAALLGRIAGFLEGPVKAGVDPSAEAATMEKVYSRLTTNRKAAFASGRKAVLQQFSAVGEETDLTAAAAKEAAEKQKGRILEDLEQKGQQLAAKAEAEKARLDDLKDQLTYQADKIKADEQKLLPDMQRVEGQAVALQRDLRAINDRLVRLQDLANREKNPDQQQRYLNDAAEWQIQRNHRMASLRELERRAAELNGQRVQLQQQRRDLESRWQREVGRGEKLRGTLDRVRTEKNKVQGKSVTGVTSQVLDQKRRAVALSAYVPLPISLEDEKTRLLETFQ